MYRGRGGGHLTKRCRCVISVGGESLSHISYGMPRSTFTPLFLPRTKKRKMSLFDNGTCSDLNDQYVDQSMNHNEIHPHPNHLFWIKRKCSLCVCEDRETGRWWGKVPLQRSTSKREIEQASKQSNKLLIEIRRSAKLKVNEGLKQHCQTYTSA